MAKETRPSQSLDGALRDRTFYRHRLLIRITHWINFACMTILLMSGLAIFNGWPALYWGERSQFGHPVLAMYATQGNGGQQTGITEVLGHRFTTTGWLGLSAGDDGKPTVRGFPSWATIPGPLWLAMARRWHFFFAWIFVVNGSAYAVYSIISRHLWRKLLPTGGQIRHLGRAVLDHLRLRFPKGAEARQYNVLQKLTYLVVMFGMAPLMVATGLTMSPWMDAAWPVLLDVFGGRQSARTIHFVTAFALLGFFIIHIAMVVLSGPLNNLRSMITGRYRIGEPAGGDADE